jgi:hypothetical protein
MCPALFHFHFRSLSQILPVGTVYLNSFARRSTTKHKVSHGRLYLPYFISRCSDTIEDHPTAPPGRATGLPIQLITRQNTPVDAADKENAVEPVEAE